MKSLPWFRLYTEMIDDEKLGLLAFEDRWHFVALLCLKGKGVLDTEPDLEMLQRKVALKMGLTCAELEKVAKRLSRMKLIDFETFQPIAWGERQMQSDSSSERVKAYRERMKQGSKQDVEQVKRFGNVSETGQEVDTDKEGIGAKAPLSSAKLPPCPHEALIDLFGNHLPTLPQPKKELWAGKNEAAMRTRWKWVMTATKKNGDRYATTKDDAVAWFDRFFAYVSKSDFLTGRSDKWTSCDLGWLMKADNFTKVLQGNYENKAAA